MLDSARRKEAPCSVVSAVLSRDADDLAFHGTSAQAPSPRDVKLVGDRFRPSDLDEMTPPQRTMIEHLLAGERAGTGGPFNVFLRSPEMGDIAQQLGAHIRFHSSLPRRLNEMAILIVARDWTAHYEWYAHKRLALQAGLQPDIVECDCGRHAAGRRCNRTSRRCTRSRPN